MSSTTDFEDEAPRRDKGAALVHEISTGAWHEIAQTRDENGDPQFTVADDAADSYYLRSRLEPGRGDIPVYGVEDSDDGYIAFTTTEEAASLIVTALDAFYAGMFKASPDMPPGFAACSKCDELVPFGELNKHVCPDAETLTEIEAASELSTLGAEIYAVPGYDSLEQPHLADAWFWQIGHRWIAVVDAYERDTWWDPSDLHAGVYADEGRPEMFARPIDDPPNYGTLVYVLKMTDGSYVEIEREARRNG